MRLGDYFRRTLPLCGVVILIGAPMAHVGADSARVKPTVKLDDSGAVCVEGLSSDFLAAIAESRRRKAWSDEQWQALFAVSVARDKAAPMLGAYDVKDGRIRFTPRFPLKLGARYRATFDPSRVAKGETAGRIETIVSLPAVAHGPRAEVVRVYPTSDRLPENLLRFYVQFSAPMSRGEAYEHIHLLGPDGKVIEGPFLELEEELWDADGKRFTLLFEPGRVKRGLKPREEEGPPLVAGRSYTLEIDGGWNDAEGVPLRETHRKKFTAVAAVETALDPTTWKLRAPGGERTAVTLSFPRSLDRALLERLVSVVDAAGKPVAGEVKVGPLEQTWEFVPTAAWKAGRYEVVVDPRLEDAVGNRVGRPFEVDLGKPATADAEGKAVRLSFTVPGR